MCLCRDAAVKVLWSAEIKTDGLHDRCKGNARLM
jgi:hypothetical protein